VHRHSHLYVARAQCVTVKFIKMLWGVWGEDKIRAALERLDGLTKDEGLSVGAQTLGVVHGIKEVIGGAFMVS
jgi:hypothetical protein